MKVVLLRHGQRSSGYGDVELSAEGQSQALNLTTNSHFQDVHLILSSPKIRCRQTIQLVADKLSLPVQIEADLDQRKSIETEAEFVRRILNFLQMCREKYLDKKILLCSHSDWLQMAVLQLNSDNPKVVALSFFACAEFRVLSFENKKWSLS